MSTQLDDVDQTEPGQPYTHRQYPPGTLVVVAKAAQELFADVLPCAGQRAEATTGYYWPQQDAAFGICRQEMVPVRYQRRIYDIPERFVTLAQASGTSCEAEGKRTGQPLSPSERNVVPREKGQGSEVARLMRLIQDETEAAQRGLTGLASEVAKHRVISRKTTEIYEHMKEERGPEEATATLYLLYQELGSDTTLAQALWPDGERPQGTV
jgi:hypothetical protein